MRWTTIRGIEDDVKTEIIGNVSLICAIREIGKSDDIVYEATLSGEKLVKILTDSGVKDIDQIGIQKDNHYEVTANDW